MVNNNAFAFVNSLPEFDNHKLVTYFIDKVTGLEGYIAIHRGNRKCPSFGATRFWNYSSKSDALKDVLRLSKMMSYKATMAGLGCGGAKAVIIKNGKTLLNRRDLFRSYAEKVNYFGGKFVTGADVGVTREDILVMRKVSPHFVGIKVEPVRFTALGLLYSIEACLKEIYGSENLENRSIAIQGSGKVGSELLNLLYSKIKNIYMTDINEKTLSSVKKNFPKVKIVHSKDIHTKRVDIFSPCALSNCLNQKTIPQLKCKIIVGGANNQLETESDGKLLHKLGILYAPDYVVNAGGLISVYDEYEYGNSKVKRVTEKVKKIGDTLEKIINESKKMRKTTISIADKMAKRTINSLST
ncbi:amino acid dehydrogenase [Patescibacteria group bacterium]|nr:amino acid dehydrogenase [Patescibacteria group bacterium]